MDLADILIPCQRSDIIKINRFKHHKPYVNLDTIDEKSTSIQAGFIIARVHMLQQYLNHARIVPCLGMYVPLISW